MALRNASDVSDKASTDSVYTLNGGSPCPTGKEMWVTRDQASFDGCTLLGEKIVDEKGNVVYRACCPEILPQKDTYLDYVNYSKPAPVAAVESIDKAQPVLSCPNGKETWATLDQATMNGCTLLGEKMIDDRNNVVYKVCCPIVVEPTAAVVEPTAAVANGVVQEPYQDFFLQFADEPLPEPQLAPAPPISYQLIPPQPIVEEKKTNWLLWGGLVAGAVGLYWYFTRKP